MSSKWTAILLYTFPALFSPAPNVLESQDCIDYGDYAHWTGGVDTPDFAREVAVSGDYAYVADGATGLQVVEVTDPRSPVIVGSVDTPGYAVAVAVSGGYAYVADGLSGLQMVDVTDSRSPVIVGSVDTPGYAAGVAVSGGYAYVAADGAGLQVVDVTNANPPESLYIVGSIDTLGLASDVAISGDYAYVVCDDGYWSDGGLRVVDITDPQSPVIVGSVDTGGHASGVVVSGDYAYVTYDSFFSSGSMMVVDITDPQSPMVVGGVETPGNAEGVAVSGSFAYVADGTSGLHILPTQCEPTSIDDVGAGMPSLPRVFSLSQNFPNPFNPATTIEYVIPEDVGNVEVLVTVYDLRGRLVRRLVDREQGSGQYKVHWDGRDERGQSLGSGVYLLAIKAGPFESRRKMVMVR